MVVSNKGVLTNGDEVRGRVRLVLDKDVTVRAITVKFEGSCKAIVNTRMTTASAPGRRDTRSDRKETHEVLSQTQKVFPPRDIERFSQSKEFTLPAGEYNYEFCFIVPLYSECGARGRRACRPFAVTHKQTMLPPSFQAVGDMARVEYFLKVIVDRVGAFKVNQSAFRSVSFRPIDGTSTDTPEVINEGPHSRIRIALEPEKEKAKDKQRKNGFRRLLPRSIKTGQPSKAFLECRSPPNAILLPAKQLPFELFLHFTTPPGIEELIVEEFTSSLVEITQLQAKNKTQNFHIETKLTTSKKLRSPLTIPIGSATPSGREDMYQVEVSELLRTILLPTRIPPTFESCNITRSYAIKFTLGIKSAAFFSLNNVRIRFNVTVNSGYTAQPPSFENLQPLEEEQLPAYEN